MARACCVAAAAMLTLVVAGRPAMAQQTASAESITAAFLLNFARFTTWPNDAVRFDTPLTLCVAADGVAEALATAARGRTIDGRRVEVRRVGVHDPVGECGLLFVGRSDSAALPRVLAALEGASVLTVSDADGFAERGGMVHVYVEDGRMRFAINIRNARAAGLSLSAQLLSLARVIDR